MDRAEQIAAIIRKHVKCDATGLSPHIASVFLSGFEAAAQEIAALCSQPEGDQEEWQDIRTAPKDRTWVLLTGGRIDYGWDGDTKPEVVVGQFVDGYGLAGQEWQFAWYDSGYYGGYGNPTHWMPLRPPVPSPPIEEPASDA